MTAFTPILYLKAGCPHCLKVRIFLLDAGLVDRVVLREFIPGDDREAAIRAELAPHFTKPTYPTLQTEPGSYLNESDEIIAYLAADAGIDPQKLPVFRDYTDGIYARYRAARQELLALKGNAG